MYKIDNVNPGDLIKASFIDGLIQAIVDLDSRLSRLEGSSALSVTPNPVMVGQTLTVVGANFSVPSEMNNVTLGGTLIVGFKDLGSPSQLAFTVPSIGNLDAGGTSLALIVTNEQGLQRSALVTVKPLVQTPSGLIANTPPIPSTTGTLTSPTTLTYAFTATAIASLGASYTASVTTTNPSFHAQFIDSNGSSLGPSTTLQLAANPNGDATGGSTPLKVQVTVDKALANGVTTDVTLSISCTTPGNTVQALNGFVATGLTVGKAVPTPPTGVTINLVAPLTTSGSIPFALPADGTPVTKTMVFSVAQTIAGPTTGSVTMQPSTGWTPTGATENIPVGNGAGTNQIVTGWTAGPTAVDASLVVAVVGDSPALTFTYSQPVTVTKPANP